MELRPEKFRKCKAEDRRLMIKKHFTEKKNKKSFSSKGSGTKDVADSADKPPGENSDARPPSRSSSPDSNCPICLEPLANKSFTDSCFHTFCFTCLLEWSKVKPECPLCKQQFKSIVHNVQSDYSYDEYHIHARHSLWNICPDQRFRYPTTMTPARFARRNIDSYQDTYHNQIESHRMRFAPHAVRLYSSTQNMSRIPCSFRIRVYNQGLWVRPMLGNRIRTVSPEFYRRNPACTHRLLPWLNRELVAILQESENQVTFVLELIMALIARYHITSQEFFMHIEPYLGDKTRHFIHEMYNFAISPHDLESYDRQAIYSGPTDTQHLDLDNEVRIVDEAFERTRSTFASRSVAAESPLRNPPTKVQGLQKLVIKKNAQNNWELGDSSALNLSNPGPSTSATAIRYSDGETSLHIPRPPSPPAPCNTFHFLAGSSSPIHVMSADDSDDEECQVVDVLKPKSERTPEIVDLSSDEEVLHTLINVSSGSANSSPIYSPRYSPTSPSYSPYSPLYSGKSSLELSPASSNHNSNFDWTYPNRGTPPLTWVPQPLATLPGWRGPPSPIVSSLHNSTEEAFSDVECVYNSNELDRSIEPDVLPVGETIAAIVPTATVTYKPYKNYTDDSTTRSPSSDNENKDIAQDLSVPKKKLSSTIVRPWAMNEAPSTSKTSKKKRCASSMHSNDATTSSQRASSSRMANDATTSEYSDNDSTDDRNSSPKKLKLRSVVAHFSFDSSEKSKDSNHRSSHKKHKDKKKKKKKKRVHRHKHRVLSDSDSS